MLMVEPYSLTSGGDESDGQCTLNTWGLSGISVGDASVDRKVVAVVGWSEGASGVVYVLAAFEGTTHVRRRCGTRWSRLPSSPDELEPVSTISENDMRFRRRKNFFLGSLPDILV